ncbi:serine hydrolase [Bythopirellula polymerisocia]|uniref:Beta-lactamase n=1 Tax=Bythopirellula polymerisocia TaxID=2528003 RepID=A0A5C6D386_9BACT|nr:serine hydrolase [Bythopirellula polymerisocia]TWU30241.1 D-alanyl-D-alanine-carboxypeptidase/endopeptidase AmpH precursor [Bythopirellula polymerisocia]
MNGPCFTLPLLCLVLNCSVGVPLALSQTVSPQQLTEEWVEKVAAPLVENQVADGLSIGYIEGEHWGIVHLGTSNRAKIKADNLTVYEIGSVSKVFTGLLLADAVVQGEIDLNAAVEVANPAGIQLPSRNGRSIQWIDLSTHRSGLPRLADNLPLTNLTNPYRDYDSNKAAEFLNQYELPRQPGESQEYSNLGGSVLGYLVAQKAGKSYETLLRERIAEPLRMTDCTIALSSDQRKRLATPHDKFGSPTALWTFADLPGAGGIHATMRDMMRFAKAQLTPPAGHLGEAIEMAWTQQCDADASGPAMGLGWMIAGDGQTRWHNGQTGGSHSALFINRELECAVVVLCNTALANEVDQLAIQMIKKAAGQDVAPEPSKAPQEASSDLAIDAKLRGRLVGRYQLAPDFIFDVQDRDGHLMVGITNQPTQEVYPDSPSRWSYRGVDATLEFNLTKSGPAQSLVLHQNGAEQIARRVSKASDDAKGDLAIDAKLRSRLVGRYQLAPNFIFNVQDRDGRLMVGITNQPTQEVFPDSPTRWSYRGVDATLEFKLTKTGPAKSLVLHQNGLEQTARRIK